MFKDTAVTICELQYYYSGFVTVTLFVPTFCETGKLQVIGEKDFVVIIQQGFQSGIRNTNY